MNSITNLLDLEDTDIKITDIQIQGQTKTLTLSTLFQLHLYHIFAFLAGFVCIHVALKREPLIIQFFKIITHLFLS